MRALRFVMLTEDGGQALVQTDDGAEQFALPVDARLRAAVAGEQRTQSAPSMADAPHRTEMPIGPREIQVRVRAGESPQDIASAYGIPLERVMRFAGAAIDERNRISGEARRARARRTGIEGAEQRVVMFGEAVDERFGAYGIDAGSVSWDSRRREDGEWLVVASWRGGDSTHSAEWLFSRATRTVTPLDDAAADLLSDRPIRPVVPAGMAADALSRSAAPPLMPGVVAFPPMPDAITGPVPKVEEVFDQEAPPEGPREVPPFVPAAPSLDFDAPPLPLGITDPPAPPDPPARPEPSARRNAPEGRDASDRPGVGALRNLGTGRREETEDERAARARIPSWDDILLGIKRRD